MKAVSWCPLAACKFHGFDGSCRSLKPTQSNLAVERELGTLLNAGLVALPS